MASQERASPCRCEFVQQWLDDHAKYFTHPVSKPDFPPLVTRIANLSFPAQVHSYHCSEAVPITNKVLNTAYIQSPYKISPVKPPQVQNHFI